MDESKLVGRVTSARISPYLQRCIGMALVPAAMARDGDQIRIRNGNVIVSATVVERPFYDPEGRRLRE